MPKTESLNKSQPDQEDAESFDMADDAVDPVDPEELDLWEEAGPDETGKRGGEPTVEKVKTGDTENSKAIKEAQAEAIKEYDIEPKAVIFEEDPLDPAFVDNNTKKTKWERFKGDFKNEAVEDLLNPLRGLRDDTWVGKVAVVVAGGVAGFAKKLLGAGKWIVKKIAWPVTSFLAKKGWGFTKRKLENTKVGTTAKFGKKYGIDPVVSLVKWRNKNVEERRAMFKERMEQEEKARIPEAFRVDNEETQEDAGENSEEEYALARIKQAEENYKSQALTPKEESEIKRYVKGRPVIFEDNKKYKVAGVEEATRQITLKEADNPDGTPGKELTMPIKHFLKVQAELADEDKITSQFGSRKILDSAKKALILGAKKTDEEIREKLSNEAGSATTQEVKSEADFYDMQIEFSDEERQLLEQMVVQKENEKNGQELVVEDYATIMREAQPALKKIRKNTYRAIMKEIRASDKNELNKKNRESETKQQKHAEQLRKMIPQVKGLIAKDDMFELVRHFTKHPGDLGKILRENESFRYLGPKNTAGEYSQEYMFTNDELDYLNEVNEDVLKKLNQAKSERGYDINSDYDFIKWAIRFKKGSIENKDHFLDLVIDNGLDLARVIETAQKFLETSKDYAPLTQEEVDYLRKLHEELEDPKNEKGFARRRRKRELRRDVNDIKDGISKFFRKRFGRE